MTDAIADAMEDRAHSYATDLTERGYQDITVFTYQAYLDNYPPHSRQHATGFGWAVRYTSDAATDARVAKGTRNESAPRKFHDRSITLFTGRYAIETNALFPNGGIIVSIAGEDVAPYWVAARSPYEESAMHETPESVILRRVTPHENSDNYHWQVGPMRFYHAIFTPAPQSVRRGPEPAGDH